MNPASENTATAIDTSAKPVDEKSLAIGVLTITATVLLVGLLLMLATPEPASAESMTARAGDYVMATHRLSRTREGVLVLDRLRRGMVIYAYDGAAKKLRAVGGYDLSRVSSQREVGR